MNDEIEFIKHELKKRGYPLESYVQSLLVSKKWHVQPNAYFLDKDTDKGRELDIKAIFDDFKSYSWSHLIINLFIQCRKLPGNAWVFFSPPKLSAPYKHITKYGLTDFLRLGSSPLGIFDPKGTHFDKSEILATNYCEVITDKKKSNKRTDNIWECVITLIKATSQELQEASTDTRQFIDVDEGSFDEFIKDPFELVSIFYPLIVFDGKMYEAKFSNDEITLEAKEYVQLFVDYISGRYKGRFFIDIVSKEGFSEYLKNIFNDLLVFNKRRLEKSEEYQKSTFKKLEQYYRKNRVF